MTGIKRFLAIIAIAVATASLGVACGADTGEEATPTSPTAAAGQTATPQASASGSATSQPTAGGSATATPAPVVEQPGIDHAEIARLLALTGDEKNAPELARVTSWINSDPLSIMDLTAQNKVVLIDFWTYTCVNCIRTLPYLKSWHDKYADHGLVIIGVHTPEFEFEEHRDNVIEAATEFGITYPIAQDNDMGTWRAFNNRYWPAKYIIDPDGLVRYSHFGEGSYDETEQVIRSLLREAGANLDSVPTIADTEWAVDPKAYTSNRMAGLTRELYAGTDRNLSALQYSQDPPYVLQEMYYTNMEVAQEYTDPGDHSNHFIYLHGEWFNGPESLRHARTTGSYDDYMAIKFNATEVNVVLRNRSEGTYDVRLTIDDGRPLTREQAGEDVWFDDVGNSYVTVEKPRMYRLVKLPSFETHEMRLSSTSDNFEVFAFTFGAYLNNPTE